MCVCIVVLRLLHAALRTLAAARHCALHVIDGASHGGCITADPERMRALLANLLAEVVRIHRGSAKRSG